MAADERAKIEPEAAYSVAQAAGAMNLNPQSVYALVASRRIRHRRVGPRGGRIEILGAWIEAYLRGCEVGPEGERPATAPRVSRPRPARARPATQAAREAQLLARLEAAMAP